MTRCKEDVTVCARLQGLQPIPIPHSICRCRALPGRKPLSRCAHFFARVPGPPRAGCSGGIATNSAGSSRAPGHAAAVTLPDLNLKLPFFSPSASGFARLSRVIAGVFPAAHQGRSSFYLLYYSTVTLCTTCTFENMHDSRDLRPWAHSGPGPPID